PNRAAAPVSVVPSTTCADLPATVTVNEACPPTPTSSRASSVTATAAMITIAPVTLTLRNNATLPRLSPWRRRLSPRGHLPSPRLRFRSPHQSQRGVANLVGLPWPGLSACGEGVRRSPRNAWPQRV